MLRVQYTGERERTVGIDVVYPGELMQATPSMLAAWRAEHGDVFAVVGEMQPVTGAGDGLAFSGGVFAATDAAGAAGAVDAAGAAVKGGRVRTR